ncbi:MAG: hypothetical protein JRI68_00510 [Deltaproteobacteria bacterium]|nr:hypothetical protein [Deltaproteobacteria bacterium]
MGRWLAMGSALLVGCMAMGGCDGDTDNPGTSTSSGTGGSAGSGGGGTGGGVAGSGGSAGQGGSGGEGGCDPVATSPNATPVDLLLMVDNSRSMADKQAVLAANVPDLVGHFTNPRCLDPDGVTVAGQPSGPSEACPGGSEREFAPVVDMHVGVISSSIGGHGSDACTGSGSATEDDQAHLLDRSEPNGGTPVPTYESLGFLAWDPTAQLQPPGACNNAGLRNQLAALIEGVGQVGCGFEAQLESWYRFLVDPNPYATITVQNGSAEVNGTDQELLDQRADFLRSDSVLVVVMLTDENDCSTRDGGQFYFANQIYAPSSSNPYHLPKPRAACATDPTDPCCRSCGQAPGWGCSTAQDDCNSGPLNTLNDSISVRCFEQKRRFGIDFMWPIDRYVTGLTAAQVSDRDGNVVTNPLFAGSRTADMVFLAGILGVPWQDIARRDSNSAPDLVQGLDGDGHAVGGVQSAAELTALGTWDVILGDLDTWVNATDPLMVESFAPRSGTNPITGDAIASAGAGYLANPINGHEYSNPQQSDLQYACIFELSQSRDCTNPNEIACDCTDSNNDNPLCQAPNGQFGTTQYFAKAYPARRELQVLKGLGSQGVVGSICPAQLSDTGDADHGYRPTLAAIAETVQPALGTP